MKDISWKRKQGTNPCNQHGIAYDTKEQQVVNLEQF